MATHVVERRQSPDPARSPSPSRDAHRALLATAERAAAEAPAGSANANGQLTVTVDQQRGHGGDAGALYDEAGGPVYFSKGLQYVPVETRLMGRPHIHDSASGASLDSRMSADVRAGTTTADYLYPPSATMSRDAATGKWKSQTAGPHAKAFDVHVLQPWGGKGFFRGRRSGEGADAGVGREADVVLGAWSCCRSIHPDARGCTSAPSHSCTTLKCAQCGVRYGVMENLRAMAGQTPNCKHHAAEPANVDAFGEPVWPCCGAVGLSNSKYHSHSGGKASEYVDHGAARFVPWGCRSGFHRPAVTPLVDPATAAAATPTVALQDAAWTLQVLQPGQLAPGAFDSGLDKLPGFVSRALAKHDPARDGNLTAEHPSLMLLNPWERMVRVDGVPAKVGRRELLDALSTASGGSGNGGILAAWPCVHDDMSRHVASGAVDAAVLEGRDAACDAVYAAFPQARRASHAAHGGSGWHPDVPDTPVHPLYVDGTWFVECATPSAAQALVEALKEGLAVGHGTCTATLDPTQTLVLALNNQGQGVWVDTLLPSKAVAASAGAAGALMGDLVLKLAARLAPVSLQRPPLPPTAPPAAYASSADRQAVLDQAAELMRASAALAAGGVVTAGRPLAAGRGVPGHCAQCSGHESVTTRVQTSKGVQVALKSEGCRYHPGFWCPALRVRQVLMHRPQAIVAGAGGRKPVIRARSSRLKGYIHAPPAGRRVRKGHASPPTHRGRVPTQRPPREREDAVLPSRTAPPTHPSRPKASAKPIPSHGHAPPSPQAPAEAPRTRADRAPSPSPVTPGSPSPKPEPGGGAQGSKPDKRTASQRRVGRPAIKYTLGGPPQTPPPRATTPPPPASQPVWYSSAADAVGVPALRSAMPSLQTEVLFQGYVIPEHDDAPLPVPPPFDVPIPVYPPSPVPTPWRWLHDTITADAVRPPPPLLLLPAHTTRKALAGAQTRAPASALTTCRGEKSAAVSRIAMPPRLPLFSPEGQGSGWVAPGVLWLAPVPMLLPPLPPRVRNTAATVVGDDPVYLPVDDGHRMRRMYPVITLPVKNRADIPITVSVWEHFAEVHPALDFHRPASWGYRLLVPDEVSHTFPPSSVSTVTLAAADPNFLSKTMMAPVALHWRQPTQAEHALLFSALPRKKWLHDRTPPGMPTPGDAPGNPLPTLMPPPPTPLSSAHATIMAAAVTSKEGNLAAARNGGRLPVGRASQHAQALWDDEVTLAGGLTSLHGGASEAMEHVLASSLAGAAGAVPLAVSDLALSRHPAYSQRLRAHSGASSTVKAAGGLHWAAPRDHRRLGGSGTPAPPGQGTGGGSTGKRRPASAGPPRRQHVTHEEALDSQAAYYAERIAADAAKTRPVPPSRRPAVTRPASASPRRKARPASAKAARRKGRPTSATPRRKSRPVSAKSRAKRAPVQFREPEAEVEEGGRAPPTRPLKPDDSDEAWQALFDAHYQKYPDVFSPIAQQEGGVGALPPFDGFGEAPSPSLKPPELRTPSGQSPRPAQALFTGASEPGY